MMADVGRPPAFTSVEDMQRKIDLYFETDAYISVGFNGDEEIRQYAPTMAGLALALGVDRKTLTNYSHKDEFFPAIKNARAKVEVALEQHLYGKNVTGAIFNLKNNFGWSDKQEFEHSGPNGQPLKSGFTPLEYAEAQALLNKSLGDLD